MIRHTVMGDGAVKVQFDYDRALLAEFKATFPSAKFNAADKSWTVRGVTAQSRVERWLATREQARLDTVQAKALAARMTSEAVMNGGLPAIRGISFQPGAPGLTLPSSDDEAPLADILMSMGITQVHGAWMIPPELIPALRARADEINGVIKEIDARKKAQFDERVASVKSKYILYDRDGHFVVEVPYSQEIVGILKSINQSRWEPILRAWLVPVSQHEALRRVTGRIEELAEQALRQKRAEAGTREHGPDRLFLPPHRHPQPGKTFRLEGNAVTVERVTRGPRIDEDDPATLGSDFLGHEGEHGVWVYYRPATPEEIAGLEQEEASRPAPPFQR